MISDVLSYLGATRWAQTGLVLFVLFFIGIIIWTCRGGRDRFRRERYLPLDDNPDASSPPSDLHRKAP